MKVFFALIIMFMLTATTVLAGTKPPKLTYESSCLYSNGYFSALIIGKGTVNQPIDWSPDKKFKVIGNTGVSNFLEGESGALGFWTVDPGAEYQVKVFYPNGVWVRWEEYPKMVTYIPVPNSC
jgi:hypothetical protein